MVKYQDRGTSGNIEDRRETSRRGVLNRQMVGRAPWPMPHLSNPDVPFQEFDNYLREQFVKNFAKQGFTPSSMDAFPPSDSRTKAMATKLTKKDKQILAYTLLGEAAGEGKEGMTAVAWVLRNRSESGRYPSHPAAAALQANKRGVHQFSTWNGDPTKKFSLNSREGKAALAAIEKVFGSNPGPDPTRGSLSYYAGDGPNAISEPYWFKKEAVAGGQKIGNHIFAARVTPQVMQAAFDERAEFGVRAPGTYKPGDQMEPMTEEELRGVTGMDQRLLDLGKPAVAVVQPRPSIRRQVLPANAVARGFGNDVGPGLIPFTTMQQAFEVKPVDRATELTTRKVNTVPIEESTGLPEVSPAKQELNKTQSWRTAQQRTGFARGTGGTVYTAPDGSVRRIEKGYAQTPVPSQWGRPKVADSLIERARQAERGRQEQLPHGTQTFTEDELVKINKPPHYEYRYGEGLVQVQDKPYYTTVYETTTKQVLVSPAVPAHVAGGDKKESVAGRKEVQKPKEPVTVPAKPAVYKTVTVKTPKKVLVTPKPRYEKLPTVTKVPSNPRTSTAASAAATVRTNSDHRPLTSRGLTPAQSMALARQTNDIWAYGAGGTPDTKAETWAETGARLGIANYNPYTTGRNVND